MTTDQAVTHTRATVHPEKADVVAELAEAFRSSTAAVLTEYRGLTVKQLQELRRAMGSETTYSVTKNTLTKLAAQAAGLVGLEGLLSGPTAVAFVKGDPVEAAKGLRDFGRANPALVVKGGVLDGKTLTTDEIRKLADLESREVLLAKLAGAMKASLTQAVYLFNAPLAQTARLVFIALGGYWLSTHGATAANFFVLAASSMVVLGTLSCASVILTRWGPKQVRVAAVGPALSAAE